MNRFHRRRAGAGQPVPGALAPSLMVWTQGSARSLTAGPSYVVGRDPQGDIVIPDARVSWRHAALRLENDRWVLMDSGSTNGTYAEGRRVNRIEIKRESLVRLSDPVSGPVLSCTLGAAAAPPARPHSWSGHNPGSVCPSRDHP